MWPPGSADTVCPCPPLTLTFDRLTFKLVGLCESHLRWGTFLPNLGTLWPLGYQTIRYVRDGRTDGRADKSNAYCPLPYGRGIKLSSVKHVLRDTASKSTHRFFYVDSFHGRRGMPGCDGRCEWLSVVSVDMKVVCRFRQDSAAVVGKSA